MAGMLLALAAPACALDDVGVLYCAQVRAEAAQWLAAQGDARAAAEAAEGARRLDARDLDLLNDAPARHARARAGATARLAALPAEGTARARALLTADEECRERGESGAAAGASRAELLARRRFCRDLMTRTAERSAALREHYSPDERAALDELQEMALRLARPLPGAPVTPAEDRAASRLHATQRQSLEAAVTARKGTGEDPVVRALNRCHDDFREGRLGAPDDGRNRVAAAPARTSAPGSAPARAQAGGLAAAPGLSPATAPTTGPASGSVSGTGAERGPDPASAPARLSAPGATAPTVPAPPSSLAPASPPAPAALPLRAFDLGPVLHVRETARGGNYEGLWRRRGATASYDGYWVHLPTGQVLADRLEVLGVAEGELRIRRRDAGGHYAAPLRPDGTLGPGTASWAAAAAFRWQPLPPQDVRIAGRTLGEVVHLRETAPGGDVHGIWRRRGRSAVYDALWVHLQSGELVRDVVVLSVEEGQLRLERPARRLTYRALTGPGGRVTGGWVLREGIAQHEWQVLPAQALPAAEGVAASLPREPVPEAPGTGRAE